MAVATLARNWSYEKDGGMRFPVKPGDIWQAGPHFLACLDLETPPASDFLATMKLADMLFVDPPWGAGLATGYRTKAGMPRRVDYEALLLRIARCILRVREGGAFFVEIGVGQTQQMRLAVEAHGAVVHDVQDMLYYGKMPCKLIRASRGPALPAWRLPGLLDERPATVASIRDHSQPGGTVLDPCLGRGLTSDVCDELGRACVGIELHPNRLSCALSKLADRGRTPVRVGAMGGRGA